MQANVSFREQLAALGVPPLEGAVPSLFIAFLKSDKLESTLLATRETQQAACLTKIMALKGAREQDVAACCSIFEAMAYQWEEGKQTRMANTLVTSLPGLLPAIAALLSEEDPRSETVTVAALRLLDAFAHSDTVTSLKVLQHPGVPHRVQHLMLRAPGELAEAATGVIHGWARYAGKELLESHSDLLEALRGIVKSGGGGGGGDRGVRVRTDNEDGKMVQAAMACAHLVGKNEISEFSQQPQLLDLLMHVANLSLQDKLYAGHEWGFFGVSCALGKVAVSDANKPHLVKAGFGQLLLHQLCMVFRAEPAAQALSESLETPAFARGGLAVSRHKSKGYEKGYQVLELTLANLLQLCFFNAFRLQLRNIPDYFLILLDASLKFSPSGAAPNPAAVAAIARDVRNLKDVIKSALGWGDLAQARLTGLTPRPSASPSSPSSPTSQGDAGAAGGAGGHVMISYSWAQQSLVLKLATALKQLGVPLWLDVNDMSGDIVESMAAAVHGAVAVLMCVSPEYKVSSNCRLEAMYALKLRKKFVPLMLEGYEPDGWLGLMMGQALYYSVSQDSDWGKIAHDITQKELAGSLLVAAPHKVPAVSSFSSGPSQLQREPVTSWSIARVGEWLEEIKLGGYKNSFKDRDINGKALTQLRLLRSQDPSLFFAFASGEGVRDGLNIDSIGDALTLAHELQQLN